MNKLLQTHLPHHDDRYLLWKNVPLLKPLNREMMWSRFDCATVQHILITNARNKKVNSNRKAIINVLFVSYGIVRCRFTS